MNIMILTIAAIAVAVLAAAPVLAAVPWWAPRHRRLLATLDDGTTFDGTVDRRRPGVLMLRDVEVTTPQHAVHDAQGTLVVQLQRTTCVQLPDGR